MVDLSRAHEEHIRELLEACNLPRDALPYTEEFKKLKDSFWERSFKELSDEEFWQAVVNVAKKGGVRGKPTIPAPRLTPEQKRMLKGVIPVPLGQRDRLPYTERFDRLVDRFNTLTGLTLDRRQVWLAILSLAK